MVTRTIPGAPAIVVSALPSGWESCRMITPGLDHAYRRLWGENANRFSLTPRMNLAEIWRLARAIHDSRPERLVFIDHAPPPPRLLAMLAELRAGGPLPPIFVHAYGDFTLHTGAWLQIERLLRGTRVLFLGASDRQCELLSRLLASPLAADRCRFPVHSPVFDASEPERAHFRQRIGAAPEDLVIAYAGRLSLQKNIVRLAAEFARFCERSSQPVWLALAGTFDDLGAPFFGLGFRPGFYYRYFIDRLASLPPPISARIRYLGHLSPGELRGLYNAADLYMSLSLHHDEDFGMSPAEALCTGTPVLLSDWGGYASFALERDSCSLLRPGLASSGWAFPSEAIQAALDRAGPVDPARRRARSAAHRERLGTSAVTQKLTRLHGSEPPPFRGFSPLMRKHAERMRRPVPFPEGPAPQGLYEEIYGSYSRSDSQPSPSH